MLNVCEGQFIIIKKYDQDFIINLGQIIEMKQICIMTQ